jgi:lipoprotein-releasing system ATP-binding protein
MRGQALCNSILKAANIVKKFPWGEGYLEVLKGASLAIEQDKLTVLSGPSGSGKSTLLYIIGGLERPDTGEVTFEGESLNSYNDNKLDDYRNRQIGFVFQMHYLLPDFTALENVIMPALIAGQPMAVARKRAFELMTDLSLSDRRDHYPNQLSGGEQQRVAVARALINSPKLILADEPTGNLDRENAGLLLKLFRKLVDHTGVSILVATHDAELAGMGDVTFKLYDGKIIGSKGLADA